MAGKFDLDVVIIHPDDGESLRGLKGGAHTTGGGFMHHEFDIPRYCAHAGIDPGDLTRDSVLRAAEAAKTRPPNAWLAFSHKPAV